MRYKPTSPPIIEQMKERPVEGECPSTVVSESIDVSEQAHRAIFHPQEESVFKHDQ